MWLVGYEAAKTNWGGFSLHLSDRGDNVLARLLAEPRLAKGNIIFVGHSLGGLVIEQVLRSAQRDAQGKQAAANFLERVRRVAFLGTPHRGALFPTIAKALGPFLRPTAALRGLVLDDAPLRDLNYWYRTYSQNNGIENLVLAEGLPQRFFGIALPERIGTIVNPGSADPGLAAIPVIVGADHTSISKPKDRQAEVYVLLKKFVAAPFGAGPQARLAVEDQTTELQRLIQKAENQTEAIAGLQRTIVESCTGVSRDESLTPRSSTQKDFAA